MKTTETVLLEVMRKDNPHLLNRLAGEAMRRGKKDQAKRFTRRSLDLTKRVIDSKIDHMNKIRGERIRSGLKKLGVATLIAGTGYGAYRMYKNRQKKVGNARESIDAAYANLIEREYLQGGKADGMPDSAFPKDQLRKGRKVEREHTRSPRVANEIAKDHLAEIKDYYTRLAKMERRAKRAGVKGVRESGNLREFLSRPIRIGYPKSTWHGSAKYEPEKWEKRSLGGVGPLTGNLSPEERHRREQQLHRNLNFGKTYRDVSLAAMGSYGLYRGANKAKELLSGRTTLYHGGDKPGIARIRSEGLRSANRTGRKGITDWVLGGEKLKKSRDAVFTTRSPLAAHNYSAQAEWLRKGMPGGMVGREFAPFHRRGGVVKFSVPLWRKGLAKHVIENPETAGQSMSDFIKGSAHGDFVGGPLAYHSLKHDTVTMKNKMPTQFQVGHKNYIPYSIKEFKQYAKQHPGRVAGGALAAVGVGAGAYGLGKYAQRAWKARKERKAAIAAQQQQFDATKQKVNESTDSCFSHLLCEGRIEPKHIELGLQFMQAVGLDKAMSERMQKGEHRGEAWKYAKRGALVGATLPVLDVAAENALGMGRQISAARASGVTGIGNVLRTARAKHFNTYRPLGEQVINNYTNNPKLVGSVVGSLAAAGGLYGLMKTPDAPRMKLGKERTLSKITMKPKKKFKYLRKEGKRYIYPKGVRQ
jgi:hypothetical protein